MSDESRLDRHNVILASMKGELDAAYLGALERGIDDPAVLVLDLWAEGAQAIARVLLTKLERAGAMVAATRRGKVPRSILGLSRSELINLIDAFTPPSKPAIDRGGPVEGYVLALVDPDGVSVVEMPPVTPGTSGAEASAETPSRPAPDAEHDFDE